MLTLVLLAIVSLNMAASCPDSSPDLGYMLKTPLGKGEIIAVVKGRLHPKFGRPFPFSRTAPAERLSKYNDLTPLGVITGYHDFQNFSVAKQIFFRRFGF